MTPDTMYVDVPASRTRVLRFRDITLTEASPYVVKGVMHAGEVVVIYGAAKSGKSFYCFHLGADVANGRPHRGRRTRRGLVVHVALESVGAITQRAVAYTQVSRETDIPYVLLDWRLDMFDVTSRETLRAQLKGLEEEYDLPLVMVIYDTLARAMPGRDENAKELGDAIAYAHDLVRHQFEHAVAVVVHHAGKDTDRGPRGHSSLSGNADGILTIENRKGHRLVSVDIHRNATEGETIAAFDLEPIVIGTDADGDPITSCVLRWTDAPAQRSKGALTPSARMGIGTLREAIRAHGEDPPSEVTLRNGLTGGERVVREEFWRDIFYRRRISAGGTPGANKKAFQRVRDKLQMSRDMETDAGYYWLLQAPGQPGQSGTPQ